MAALTARADGSRGRRKRTQAGRARRRHLVERDILTGTPPPGSRLVITELAQRYDIGATPLREGLVAAGLEGARSSAIGQRGFRRVAERQPRGPAGHHADVHGGRGRGAATCHAKRRRRLGSRNHLSTLHQMRRHIERVGNRITRGRVGISTQLHKAFSIPRFWRPCGSARLLAAHRPVRDQAYRYRRVTMRGGFDSGERVR